MLSDSKLNLLILIYFFLLFFKRFENRDVIFDLIIPIFSSLVNSKSLSNDFYSFLFNISCDFFYLMSSKGLYILPSSCYSYPLLDISYSSALSVQSFVNRFLILTNLFLPVFLRLYLPLMPSLLKIYFFIFYILFL